MARLSPGVYANEFNFSEYAPQLGLARPVLVGGASKGPLNVATVVTNEADLVEKFGAPLLDDYGLQSAVQFLKKGSNMLYLRVHDGTATRAQNSLTGGLRAFGTIDVDLQPADGDTITITDDTAPLVFEFDDDASITGDVSVAIGSTVAETAANLIAAIEASSLNITPSVDPTGGSETINLLADSIGVAFNTPITFTEASAGTFTVTGMADGVDAPVSLINIEAISEGTWGNQLRVEVVTSQQLSSSNDPNARDLLVKIPINGVYTVVERFYNFSLDPENPRYIETLVTEGIRGEQTASTYIKVDVPLVGVIAPDYGVVAVQEVTLGAPGTQAGTNGISGLAAADYVGTVVGQIPTGLKALRNPERIEFNLLAVPGVSDSSVINEIVNLCEYRADCLALIDPPIGLDKDQIVAWHNGTSVGVPSAPTQPIDTSRATLNWSWVRTFDQYSEKNVWLPPSGFICANIAENDRVAAPWFPYAGHNRGRIDGDEVEYSPNQEDRHFLQENQNAVNPIVDFAEGGLTLFGNRTLQRRPTALTSVHVRRMLLHAQKMIATATKYLVFEPNEPVTWRRFTLLVNPILEYIASSQGLEEFRVICDESTNPPAQRNNKTMRAKLFLTPVLASEVIILDFMVFASGADFSEVN